jgi:hypothetical protein
MHTLALPFISQPTSHKQLSMAVYCSCVPPLFSSFIYCHHCCLYCASPTAKIASLHQSGLPAWAITTSWSCFERSITRTGPSVCTTFTRTWLCNAGIALRFQSTTRPPFNAIPRLFYSRISYAHNKLGTVPVSRTYVK